jgi:hypothetical protein
MTKEQKSRLRQQLIHLADTIEKDRSITIDTFATIGAVINNYDFIGLAMGSRLMVIYKACMDSSKWELIELALRLLATKV